MALRQRLEEGNISEKPWILKGEVRAADRPENSVMEEYLEYNSGLRHSEYSMTNNNYLTIIIK